MAAFTKWYVFGRRRPASTGTIANAVYAALESIGIDRSDADLQAWPLDGVSADLGARTAHLFESTGSLLPVEFPDTMLIARIPTSSDTSAAITDAWRGSAAYAVEETVIVDGPPTGLCRMVVVTRNPALTRAEFSHYWSGHHAPLVLKHIPLFHRYVQNRVINDESVIDGIAEQWFHDKSRVDEHDRLNAEEKPEVASDLRRFIHGSQQLLTVARADPAGAPGPAGDA
jgi:uncharacterized protein (TIGR02118 family)